MVRVWGSAERFLKVGEWQAEPRRNRLFTELREVRVEPQVMEVLLCLAARPGEVVSRDELIAEAWGGRAVSDEALSVAVHGLRKALGDQARNPRYIETVPRRGYRLVATVSTPEPVADPILEPRPVPPPESRADPGSDDAALPEDGPGEPPGPAPPRDSAAQGVGSASGPWPHNRRQVGWLAGALGAVLALGLWWALGPRGPAPFLGPTEGPAAPVGAGAATGPGTGLAQPLSEPARREFELGYLHIMRLTPEDVGKARHHFGRCTELDPGYAPAWAGLSAALLRPAATDRPDGVADRLDRARRAAERSVELDPELPDAHVAAARVRLYLDWHPAAAEEHLRRALDIDPRDSHAHQLNAAVQLSLGRPDSAELAARRAIELEPAVPVRYVELAGMLILAGRYEAAGAELDRALELAPRLYEARSQRPFVELLAGRHGEFYRRFRETWDGSGLDPETIRAMEDGHGKGGVQGLLRAFLGAQGPALPASERAKLRVLAGQPESALEDLETCLAARCTQLLWLDVDPVWEPLRDHPAFAEISRQIRDIRKS